MGKFGLMEGESAYPFETQLPISLVAHTVFCPRRAWLEQVGERTESFAIESGSQAHARVDRPEDSRPVELRARAVTSARLGLTGRADVVEKEDDGKLTITEYKSSPLAKRTTVSESTIIQLALQGICLEEEGNEVAGYRVYFSNSKNSVDVPIDESIRARAIEYVKQTREICESATAPQPLDDDSRCAFCSHVSICLPDERKLAPVVRKIRVRDPEGQVLHLATPGSRASIRSGRVVVSRAGEKLGDVPIEKVQGVTVSGNVDLSSALIRELHWRDISIVWCSSSGRVYGWSRSAHSPNGLPRRNQHVASAHGHMGLAREFIVGKIAGQATLYRRSCPNSAVREHTLEQLRALQHHAADCTSISQLMGIEGKAAAIYFHEFPHLLKSSESEFFANQWPGRHGRGASDPLNCVLNYLYALLLAETIKALVSCGLDPHAGFLHSSGRNKPALALDLMEEFRAAIADSVALTCINKGMLSEKHFSTVTGTHRLLPSGRKILIKAFEQRMATQITHPTFHYKATWRRVIEIQARLILGVLDGTQPNYTAFRTR